MGWFPPDHIFSSGRVGLKIPKIILQGIILGHTHTELDPMNPNIYIYIYIYLESVSSGERFECIYMAAPLPVLMSG